ncbi:glycosyltransferase [Mycobacterium sp. 852014-52144_SCH5372336]|uniref:glycosyltransferase n=1 Tax=Mycobacterium sp. 852014-52144_SCH5372336 TaxID=1834115 RepID=UPI000800E4C8|nr:glycosyltransferase [Mycobacterium sp. 852014-52144_SCH5372336]OBB75468.1 glycosyl transferase family 1 [Mycobacterium sp. 852014-52144_SCH5372336]
MKFVLASYGSRGDVEPCVAIGRELLRRGHDVRVAVAPDLVGFAEAAGLTAVPYGSDTQAWLSAHRDFWTRLFRKSWKVRGLIDSWRDLWGPVSRSWSELSATLTPLAHDADLLFTGVVFEGVAANIAEYYDIPLATLHYHPTRKNRQSTPLVPARLARAMMTANDWVIWRLSKKADDAQRRELGLPRSTRPVPRRITERGSLEIQGYDEAFVPGLAEEWAAFGDRRPFVGTLTMELSTDVDAEVSSWIAAGSPPIYFGFGSVAVGSAAETVAMISAACAELGERALICSGTTDFGHVSHPEHIKVVETMNHAAIFPMCRAVVHHGGAATTATGLRAGVPSLVLWTWPDQRLRGRQVSRRLKVGATRRLSDTTQESLVADLRRILEPQCLVRAREVAARMTKPSESINAAADAVENFAASRVSADR